MIEGIIIMLIWLVLMVIVCIVVVWVLQECGITLPPKVIRLLFVIAALIALLLLIRLLGTHGMLVLP